MKKATFVEIDPNGRGVCMRFRLEPAHKGAGNAFYSALPDGSTVVLAAGPDWGPMPRLDDGDLGVLFASEDAAGAKEAFASFGYGAVGTPAPVVRKVTMVWAQAGTAADSVEAIVNRCLKGRDEPEVRIETEG